MTSNTCFPCLKRTLIVLCVLNAIGALVLSVMGIVVYVKVPNVPFAYVPVSVILSSAIIALSILGTFGAFRESSRPLIIYGSVMSGVVFSLAVILLFIGIAVAPSADRPIYNITLHKYYDRNESQYKKAWDQLQKTYKCCGVHGAADWKAVNGSNGTIPGSCGKEPFKRNGCIPELTAINLLLLSYYGAPLLIVCIACTIGVIIGCTLGCKLRRALPVKSIQSVSPCST